jgi:hypothetical protein
MHLAEPDTSLCRQIYALETGLGPLKCNEKGYGSRFSGYLAFYSHVRWSFSKRQSMLAYSGFLEKNGDSSTFPHFRPAIFFPARSARQVCGAADVSIFTAADYIQGGKNTGRASHNGPAEAEGLT